MRNIDRLQHLSLKELAPYFVYSKTVYELEDEFEVYVSPSGLQYLSCEDAIEDCVRWLGSAVLSEDTQVYCTNCDNYWIDENETPRCEYYHECDLNDCEDSRPYRERPKYRKVVND